MILSIDKLSSRIINSISSSDDYKKIKEETNFIYLYK